MTESSTIHLPTACPEWCTLHAPEKLHQHESDTLVIDGQLHVYVDHERSFRINDKAASRSS